MERIFPRFCLRRFLGQTKRYKELSKAIRFTEKARALGLGTLGFHSLLQSKMIPFENFEAHMLNTQVFSRIKQQTEAGSKNLARLFGEPEWCKGTGMRNATLMASSAQYVKCCVVWFCFTKS